MREKPSWHKHQYHSFISRSLIRPALNRPTETKLPAQNYRSSLYSTSKVAIKSLTKSSWIPLPEPPGVTACLRTFQFRKPRISKARSEEHTSELQSHSDLVCRLLL